VLLELTRTLVQDTQVRLRRLEALAGVEEVNGDPSSSSPPSDGAHDEHAAPQNPSSGRRTAVFYGEPAEPAGSLHPSDPWRRSACGCSAPIRSTQSVLRRQHGSPSTPAAAAATPSSDPFGPAFRKATRDRGADDRGCRGSGSLDHEASSVVKDRSSITQV
jgi:hypothetical protein